MKVSKKHLKEILYDARREEDMGGKLPAPLEREVVKKIQQAVHFGAELTAHTKADGKRVERLRFPDDSELPAFKSLLKTNAISEDERPAGSSLKRKFIHSFSNSDKDRELAGEIPFKALFPTQGVSIRNSIELRTREGYLADSERYPVYFEPPINEDDIRGKRPSE